MMGDPELANIIAEAEEARALAAEARKVAMEQRAKAEAKAREASVVVACETSSSSTSLRQRREAPRPPPSVLADVEAAAALPPRPIGSMPKTMGNWSAMGYSGLGTRRRAPPPPPRPSDGSQSVRSASSSLHAHSPRAPPPRFQRPTTVRPNPRATSSMSEALRVVRRELEFQAVLHAQEMEEVHTHLGVAVRELGAVTAERDALLSMVLDMHAGGWAWHGAHEAALERDGGSGAAGMGVADDPSLLDTLAGASAARQQLLDAVAAAGTSAWEDLASGGGGGGDGNRRGAAGGPYCGGARPVLQLSEEAREEIAERLHGEGEALRERKHWLIERYKRANPHDLHVGVTRLSEADRRKAAERMYAAAEDYRRRREQAAESEFAAVMHRAKARSAHRGGPLHAKPPVVPHPVAHRVAPVIFVSGGAALA